jgi:hypothetical protein
MPVFHKALTIMQLRIIISPRRAPVLRPGAAAGCGEIERSLAGSSARTAEFPEFAFFSAQIELTQPNRESEHLPPSR